MSSAENTPSIGFDQLADLFVEQGALVSPSELHGYLCGQLAAGQRHSPNQWLAEAIELLGVEELSVPGIDTALEGLRLSAQSQLETQGFELQLLLPDDDLSVAERADALGVWCHGFVSGYALAGGSPSEGLSADARDALEDFSQIAQIAVDSDDEESLADFEEIYEYVRMGALLLFSECNRADQSTAVPPGTQIH